MKIYIQHLCQAILGCNPFQKELDDLSLRYAALEGDYAHAFSVVADLESRLSALDAKLAETEKVKAALEKEKMGYQNLTENLRKRVQEKENALVEIEQDYEKRFAEQGNKIRALQEDLNAAQEQLLKANNVIGKDLMARPLLDKTNNGLEDLAQAMQRGDTEAMMEVTQGLDWSNHLTRIAQQHLMVLKRKNELEARLYEKRFDTESGAFL